jgi:hypothetical protein
MRLRLQLKEIFFSGQPWLIQCIGGGIPIDSTFAAAAPFLGGNKEPYSVVKTAALPCGDKLPSGKTIYERFKLDSRTRPLVALFVNGNRPMVVSSDALQMPQTLVKRVSEASKLRISDVSTPQSFGRACLEKPNKLCFVVIPYTGLSTEHNATLRALAGAHRTVHFAVLNAKNVELSIEKSLPVADEAEAAGGEHIRIAAIRVFPDNSAQALAYRGAFDSAAIASWIGELVSGETDLNMLSKKPSASRRRKMRDPNEDEATRNARRAKRRASREAQDQMVNDVMEQMLAKLTPEEREKREAELKLAKQDWERKRRAQMEQEADSIFEDDDDDDDDDEGGGEGEGVEVEEVEAGEEAEVAEEAEAGEETEAMEDAEATE